MIDLVWQAFLSSMDLEQHTRTANTRSTTSRQLEELAIGTKKISGTASVYFASHFGESNLKDLRAPLVSRIASTSGSAINQGQS